MADTADVSVAPTLRPGPRPVAEGQSELPHQTLWSRWTKPRQGKDPRTPWQRDYVKRLRVTDLLVILWAVFAAQLIWFDSAALMLDFPTSGSAQVSYTVVSLVLAVCWYIALGALQSRDPRIIGLNSDEYRRVGEASLWVFGLFAMVSYLLKLELARGYFLTTIPLGVLGLLTSRWLWRNWLHLERRLGHFGLRVVIVGSPVTVTTVARQLIEHPEAGYFVAGVCVDHGEPGTTLGNTGIPVLGSVSDAIAAMDEADASTLVVTASRLLPPRKLRELSWALEPGRRHLVMAPTLIDVAGPRISTRPVAGLPLMHVETPRYEGGARAVKRSFDICSTLLGLLLLSPLLIVVAIAVKLDSPGPILFRQDRVGKNGTHFKMLKFRSMRVGAEAMLAKLEAERLAAGDTEVGNSVMFKMKHDPRVTRVGRVLRRYSIDEFPQFFNVLKGDMSLVGPRPPLPREVELYESDVTRKFLVKPGITGLWQVSGRSNLDWDASVRLDLYYVENWTLAGDMVILWRTARAVFARQGAY